MKTEELFIRRLRRLRRFERREHGRQFLYRVFFSRHLRLLSGSPLRVLRVTIPPMPDQKPIDWDRLRQRQRLFPWVLWGVAIVAALAFLVVFAIIRSFGWGS